jgi:hypothetical protein
MPPGPRVLRAVLAAAVALPSAACGGGGGGGSASPIAPGALVPDFALPDVNDASPSFATDVSPRDLLGAASAWYFGHAT